jgi:AraC-like DNA-binding protein
VLWLPMTSGYAIVAQEATEDFSGWCGTFGRDAAQGASRDADTDILTKTYGEGGLACRLSKLSARRLETQFEHLAATELDTDQFGAGLEYLLLSAWAECQKAAKINDLTDVHPAVEKAAYILRTQPETGSMQELAQVCGASPSWLSRLFRQQVGISLVGFRNQSRIERFFELYGEGHRRNLTQAAYAAGFGSYAQFHRVFKEALGYSPGELKRNMQERAGSGER